MRFVTMSYITTINHCKMKLKKYNTMTRHYRILLNDKQCSTITNYQHKNSVMSVKTISGGYPKQLHRFPHN